jgi:hypothetical protein
MDVAKLKVAELKELLRERGLGVSGKKADLVKRLEEAIAAEEPAEASSNRKRGHDDDELEDDPTPSTKKEKEVKEEQEGSCMLIRGLP